MYKPKKKIKYNLWNLDKKKKSACSAGDLGLIPGLGRSPGEGHGNPLQYSGLENSRNCIVHEVAKSRTGLSDFHFTGGWGKESSRYGNPGLLGHVAPVLGFMVMGLAPRFSLANHSGSGPFLVGHALPQDEFQREGFWAVVGHVVSRFALS